jgi:uncharacterized protein YegP (UPF0339 family)
MAGPWFENYKDAGGKFRFRLKAANGETIAASEVYESKAGCENGIESVKKNASVATVKDLTTTHECCD